jgi:hypothetical protein
MYSRMEREYVRVPFCSYFVSGKYIFMYLFMYVVLLHPLRYEKLKLHRVHTNRV